MMEGGKGGGGGWSLSRFTHEFEQISRITYTFNGTFIHNLKVTNHISFGSFHASRADLPFATLMISITNTQ